MLDRENIVYIYLAENLQPDFRTISDIIKEIRDWLLNSSKTQLSTTDMVKASASKNNVVLEEFLRVTGEYINNGLKKVLK